MSNPIRLGTRASALARSQARIVAAALAETSGREVVEVQVTTQGDDLTIPLTHAPGMFVSALRDALLAGEVDLVVHSYKDLPSAAAHGIALGAVLGREDPREALVSVAHLTLAQLPAAATVGTSSPRRSAALRALRPDLTIVPIRGNVDTRIRKVREGQVDAVVLALAGLRRLGRQDEVAEIFDPSDLLPAPAQGALAVECRADDEDMSAWLGALDDPAVRLVTSAEREVLVGVSAACDTAVGALAIVMGNALSIRAELAGAYGIEHATTTRAIDVASPIAARALGLRAAADLLGATSRPPVLLVRDSGNIDDLRALARVGIPAVCDPYLAIRPVPAPGLLEAIAETQWVVVSSPRALPSWAATAGADVVRTALAGVRTAAIGEGTAATLRDFGAEDVVVATKPSAQGLLDALGSVEPATAVWLCGDRALRAIPDGLTGRGWDLTEGVVYTTATVPDTPASVELIRQGEISGIVLRSPSAVQALLSFVTPPGSIPIICSGPTTARAAAELGLAVSATARSPEPVAIAAAVAAHVAS